MFLTISHRFGNSPLSAKESLDAIASEIQDSNEACSQLTLDFSGPTNSSGVKNEAFY